MVKQTEVDVCRTGVKLFSSLSKNMYLHPLGHPTRLRLCPNVTVRSRICLVLRAPALDIWCRTGGTWGRGEEQC